MDGVILLVINSDAFFMFADTVVADGFKEVDSFIDDDLMLL